MTDPFERICCEVNSKCGNLLAASRLLKDLPAPDAAEMLRLMAEEASALAGKLISESRDGDGH